MTPRYNNYLLKFKVFIYILIPIFICGYLLITVFHKAYLKTKPHRYDNISAVEIFPFFSWSLFSSVPSSYFPKHYIRVYSVDGEAPVNGKVDVGYAEVESIRIKKVLEHHVSNCESVGMINCKTQAIADIKPFIDMVFQYEEIEVSLVKCFINFDSVKRAFLESEGYVPRVKVCDKELVFGRWIVEAKE